MGIEEEVLIFSDFPEIKDHTREIIKVIGVGGGGGNAVNNMYNQGVHNVSFAVCNTDSQALNESPVPVRVQIGNGLGAGGDPDKGREAAQHDMECINKLFDDGTQMVFVTAGMGGGTGTGAGPIIAQAAKDRGILTIGVVTIPFVFEQSKKIKRALSGVSEMRKSVDALLVINNEKLRDIYVDFSLQNAFQKADDILMVATRSIAEIITRKGIVNRDFCDVRTVMENGGCAIMSEGRASGEHRVEKAMFNALNSPLLNNMDIRQAKRMLYVIYQSEESPLMTNELDYVTDFMNDLQSEVDVNWGLYSDETLGEEVKVSIIATGFDTEEIDEQDEIETKSPKLEALRAFYYGDYQKKKDAVIIKLNPTLETPIPDETENLDNKETIAVETEDSKQFDSEKEILEPKNHKERLKEGWVKFISKLNLILDED